MPTETTQVVHNSPNQLWLVAGIPALLIIAFLIYSAYSQSSKSHDENAGSTTQDESAPGDESGK